MKQPASAATQYHSAYTHHFRGWTSTTTSAKASRCDADHRSDDGLQQVEHVTTTQAVSVARRRACGRRSKTEFCQVGSRSITAGGPSDYFGQTWKYLHPAPTVPQIFYPSDFTELIGRLGRKSLAEKSRPFQGSSKNFWNFSKYCCS